jgi:hypothetical protein
LLTRLTKTKRLKAGKLLALLYVLCVLAPSLGFAFSAGSRAASRLVEDEHRKDVALVHYEADRAVAYVLAGHSAPFQEASDDGSGERSANVVDEPDRRKSSHGQCCGMLCVSALTAEVAELTKPPTLTSRCELAIYRQIADNAPAALYRPPNS